MQSNSHTGALIVIKSYLIFAITALNVYLGFLPGIKIPTSDNVLSNSVSSVSLNTFIGSYYKGTNFETLKVSGVESASVGFDWGNNTPYKSIGRNGFSVRWNGTFDFKNSATYKFTAAYDDGFRLYVDGIPVIDDWKPGGIRSDTKEISLAAGQHNLQVDYFENIGNSRVILVWAEATTAH